MNLSKLPRYLGGAAKALLTAGPRGALKLLSKSPYLVEEVKGHGFSIILSSRDPAISRPILFIQEYEANVTAALLAHLKEDTHFLDIGANIGYFSLLAAVHCPAGRVLSFEPDPENFRLLSASIALNNLQDRVTAYEMAASDHEEVLFFSNLGNRANLGARFTAKKRETLERRAPAEVQQVRAVCLDTFLENERIDVVKVDIEGYEPHAFKGMAGLLQRNRPVVITEFAPGTIQHISETDPKELLSFVIDLGYRINVIEEDGSITALGDDTDAAMRSFERRHAHHIDLLLEPAGRGGGGM